MAFHKTENSGFSLPEILITLGIIGVVAALTIPTLIQNSNSKKFITQFKKSLSTLNQAVINAHAQYDMDYSLLTSVNEVSSCASDALSAGKLSMCGLFNNTLSGHTFQGKYGSVKGANAKDAYSAEVSSFSIENFLIFSFADGAFVAFNPNAKDCGINAGSVVATTDISANGKLANCLGFIDVNGPNPPNREVSCADGSTTLSVNTTCKITNGSMGDIFPIVFHDGHVHTATNAALSAFLGGNGKEGDSTNSSDNTNTAVAEPIAKKITFNGNDYEFNENMGGYFRKDPYGNYISSDGTVYTKQADGNYVASDAFVYDENLNTIGRNYNGYWFDFKGDVLVRPIENGKYKGQGGMIYTPNAEGNYNRSDGAVLDSNFNILGMNKNNSWYDYKNGTFVKTDPATGNYVGSDGKVYTKNADGLYVNNNIYYDKDMNIVGEYYKGNWFDNRSGLFVRQIGEGTYKGHSMTYKLNADGLIERSDGNIYDDEFVFIGHK